MVLTLVYENCHAANGHIYALRQHLLCPMRDTWVFSHECMLPVAHRAMR